MSEDKSSSTIVGAARSARSLASPSVRWGLIGGIGVLAVLVIWRMVSPATEVRMPKSRAELDLEKIMDSSKQAGSTAVAPTGQAATKQSDQPTGDAAAMAALTEAKSKADIEARKKAETEERLLSSLAYRHYLRRFQGLKHDPVLAAEWDRRLREAKAGGKTPPQSPGELTNEDLEMIRRNRPDLYAQWSSTVEGGAPGGSTKVAGAPSSATTGAANVPAGIDPKTGLPLGAVASVGGQEDVVYALLEDGSPDLARGAVPVTVQYDLPGTKEKGTKTIWVRPGYLSGRSRPIDPAALKDEDDQYRRALKDPTEVPHDASANVAIPFRYNNGRTRVAADADFSFQNRYVVAQSSSATQPAQKAPTGGKK